MAPQIRNVNFRNGNQPTDAKAVPPHLRELAGAFYHGGLALEHFGKALFNWPIKVKATDKDGEEYTFQIR